MPAKENTKKNPSRDTQRNARKLAEERGISYQAALQKVRLHEKIASRSIWDPEYINGSLPERGLVRILEEVLLDLSPAQKILLGLISEKLSQLKEKDVGAAERYEREVMFTVDEIRPGLQAGVVFAPGSSERDSFIMSIFNRLEEILNPITQGEDETVEGGATDLHRKIAARRRATAGAEAADPPEKCIKKVYFYGGDDAGEVLLDYNEFAGDHIQDDEVALDCAGDMLRYGESRNDDEHEHAHELYTIEDRKEFIAQVKAELEEYSIDSFDMKLLEIGRAHV